LVYFDEIGSTNSEAKRLALQGAAEGTVVAAGFQTGGRGRLGREWVAPRGSSLLISVVLRPELEPRGVQQVTMVCGLAAVEAIEAVTGVAVGLKWPNDLVAGSSKLGGILTEVALDGDRVDYAVVGTGINVNLDPARLPQGLRMPATSLSCLVGRQVSRLSLVQRFLLEIEKRYDSLKAGSSLLVEWSSKLATLGTVVRGEFKGLEMTGLAESVDADGGLLVRLDSGDLVKVLAGDVDLVHEL
jgi:BirA family biotin operon repressor/biotin-[acetyl-CoA-carboxylase] ligase